MTIKQLRFYVQHGAFAVLSFGQNAGIFLGTSLPCFSCPYVAGCGGWCYLHRLQSDLALPVSALFSYSGLESLLGLLSFMGLLILFGKSWCGWICPFGLLQDWFTRVRRFLGIREAILSRSVLQTLNFGKYMLLFYMLFVSVSLLHVDLFRPFCAICPAKILMPAITGGGKANFLFLDYTNGVTLFFSFILLSATGIVLVGMFFKERFFCFFCPISALMHLTRNISLLRLTKYPVACHGCGTCSRVCPADLDLPHTTMHGENVQADGCTGCFQCAESCCSHGALRVTFGHFSLFESSRKHAARLRPLASKNTQMR